MGRISRPVPLDQLRPPETDVREHRQQDDIQSLAASMGDADVGQLQDVLVHPVDYEDVVEEGTDEELHELFADGHPMRIVDGETRRMAAEMLGWASLDATIVPEPPTNTVVAQLDANTERIAMSQFETVRALYDWREETGATLAEVAEKTGFSESYLSDVFSTMDCPDWLVEAWRHPDHPLETSHARAVKSFLTDNTIQEYAHAGGLDDQEAYEKAVDDAQLMIDVQGQHDLQVGEFRKRCQRCKKETIDSLKDKRSHDEKVADGQTEAAERTHDHYAESDAAQATCRVCGQDADRKIAIDVCQQDYGMLSEMTANDDVLMAQADQGQASSPAPADSPAGPEEAAHALAQASGIPPEQALQVIQQVQQEAQQAPQGGQDD